jgi:hypothetical protein
LAEIKESADHVNDVITQRENREAIQAIEPVGAHERFFREILTSFAWFQMWGGAKLSKPGRLLTKQGPLIKRCRRDNKQFEFILFSDAMVYGMYARLCQCRFTKLTHKEQAESAHVCIGYT